MELPILLETQPFIPAHEMGEHQGRKVGVMGESPIFAQVLGENCGRMLANKMASYTNLNFTIDQMKHTYIYTQTLTICFLTLINSVFTTVKLHRVTDIINHNALVKCRILTAQSLSVLNMDYKHVQVKLRATKGMNVDKKVTLL